MERIFQFSTPFLNIFYLFLFCRCKKWNCWKVGKELPNAGSLHHFSDVYRHVIFKKDFFTQICLIVSPYSWRTSIVKKFHALKCCILNSGFSLKIRAALWIQHKKQWPPDSVGCQMKTEIMEDLTSKQDKSHAGRIANTPCWVRVQWYVQLIIYAKNSKLKRQHIKTKKLLGPLLYLFLIYDTFLNNLIVMAVNPVQTNLFPLTSSCREKKGEGVGGGGTSEGPILYFETPLMTYDTVTKITQDHVLNISNQDILWLTQWRNAHDVIITS